MLTEEHLIVPFGAERRKLFLKVRRNPQIGPGEFRSWWLDKVAPQVAKLLSETGSCRGYAQNHARPADKDAPEPLCDCVDEIASGEAPGVDALLAGPIRDIAGFSDHVRELAGIWTEETVLHPATP